MAEGVLGIARSDSRHAPGKRSRHSVPLGDLHAGSAAASGCGSLATLLPGAPHGRRTGRDHYGDSRCAGVLLRRGLSPAISCEESRRVLRDWRVWSALQICGVTGGGEGVVADLTLVSAVRQRVTTCRIQDPADFCRKTAADFGAEVYRNSTGRSLVGKSAGKELLRRGPHGGDR